MPDPIEFDIVDTIAAGAVGKPGQRTFLIQAVKDGLTLSVLVEKQQIALFAAEVCEFLDRIVDPAEPVLDAVNDALCGSVVDAEPLFRAQLIGIGYDPDRELILIELREAAQDDDVTPTADDEPDGFVARLYATRAQIRAMAKHGAASVERGRPPCPLCTFPMDPEGHICPRWN
jgi:uncharacterized repeat protein (TIGR03847 family)